MHFGDAVSRCDRSVIGGLLEEQVKYLTQERDRILLEQRVALQNQLEEHQKSLNHLAEERVEYERNLGEVEAECEEVYEQLDQCENVIEQQQQEIDSLKAELSKALQEVDRMLSLGPMKKQRKDD